MNITQRPSPNFTEGRKGRKIIAIVNHITAGLMPGTLSLMCNPIAKASAHYLITKIGEIYQLVDDNNRAWHAGEVRKPNWSLYDGTNPNYCTLGIEHEALAGESLTDKQYEATLWLHKMLTQKWNIPIDTDHIIGHYRLDSVNRKNDPGPKFPWSRLIYNMKGGSGMADTEGKSPCVHDINGVLFPGFLKGGTAFLYSDNGIPIRDVAAAFSHGIEWNGDTQTVIIRTGKLGEKK